MGNTGFGVVFPTRAPTHRLTGVAGLAISVDKSDEGRTTVPSEIIGKARTDPARASHHPPPCRPMATPPLPRRHIRSAAGIAGRPGARVL